MAGQLPDRLGLALVDTAREAFIQGLHLASAISAAGSILLAILVVAMLRRARTGPERHEQPDLETGEPAGPSVTGAVETVSVET